MKDCLLRRAQNVNARVGDATRTEGPSAGPISDALRAVPEAGPQPDASVGSDGRLDSNGSTQAPDQRVPTQQSDHRPSNLNHSKHSLAPRVHTSRRSCPRAGPRPDVSCRVQHWPELSVGCLRLKAHGHVIGTRMHRRPTRLQVGDSDGITRQVGCPTVRVTRLVES